MKIRLSGALAIAIVTPTFFASAAPAIEYVSGEVTEDGTITIEGTGFGDKPHDKPYFWWNADNGRQPSTLGRKQSWDTSFNGQRTQELAAKGSTHSYKFDHGKSTGAALGGVGFDSDQLFLWRKTYEDFAAPDSFAIRSRVKNVRGNLRAGQTLTGLSSGATGVIDAIEPAAGGKTAIYFKQNSGSIAKNRNSPTDFVYGEKVITDTATATNAEGTSLYPTGTFRTFNFKTLRLWNTKYGNNIYVGAGRNQEFNILPENTDGMLWSDSMNKKLLQKPFQWKTEEIYYRASDIGKANGVFDFLVNGEKFYNHSFQTRSFERPSVYNRVYQSQVSNGAQNNTYIYYDSLYIDDSWHRVLICNESTWRECESGEIQIPKTWSKNSVTVRLNLGELKDKSDKIYLYVSDGDDRFNEKGYKLCSSCPNPPVITSQ